jgi:hypothetical protein
MEVDKNNLAQIVKEDSDMAPVAGRPFKIEARDIILKPFVNER